VAKKSKYYVVWEGNTPGIYDSWTKCQLQIKGYPGARYKSFVSEAEAKAAYHGHYDDFVKRGTKTKSTGAYDKTGVQWDSIAVDAACSGNPGTMEYRGVQTKDAVELFRQGPFRQGTNNVGEFLAIVHALAQLKKEGKSDLMIYTDSRTAMAWVRKKKANTKLKQTAANKILFQLITRAEKWLKENTFQNPIVKWETKKWGEIPADFGRK